MQIKRLEIGFWRRDGKIVSCGWPHVEYTKGLCGCRLFSIGPLCITWLGDECLLASASKSTSTSDGI